MNHTTSYLNQTPYLNPTHNSNLTADHYYLKAEKLFNKQQWNEAQKILQESILKTKDNNKIYHLLGLSLYHQGCFQRAIEALKIACENSSQSEYFLNLSIILNDLGKYTEAKKYYKKASHIQNQLLNQTWKKTIANNHYLLGNLYLKKNQYKQALEEYIKSSEFYSHPKVEIQIAHLLWKLNKKNMADKHLKNFITLYPKDIKAHLLLAQWYFEEKQIAEAIDKWEHVLKLQPKNITALNCLLKVQQMDSCFI